MALLSMVCNDAMTRYARRGQVVEVEPRRLVLLVKGQLLPRPTTNSHPAVEMHMAPCLLTDVSGRLVFTKDTKMFLIPVSVVERARCVLKGDFYGLNGSVKR